MNRLLLSAAHKSSGKTTVTLGLCAAWAARGLRVQAFKKGPDYIDPMWLSRAAQRPCHNLDFYTMDRREILATVGHFGAGSDVALVEGNKGLYDGLDMDGSNSNAALAKLLQTPVVLVLDARGMTRGIAPLILGYQAFDPDVRIAGVILNQLGGHRHESKLRAVIEHYTDVPVVGAVHRDPELQIVERHLGLIPENEADAALAMIDRIGHRIASQVDLDRLLELARSAPPLEHVALPGQSEADQPPVRIGVAQDAAFGFYYPG
ncbi:MAG TPA: cobyrinate a,c-diamide synthase, partial [Gammaproteobacteria bacterium]|nr:cobyrinate a,c-diamide synthase [Gammaproteobacteria bacterium]